MNNLQSYIKEKYNSEFWYVEEVQSVYNQQKKLEVSNLKDYLNGKHKIQRKESYKFNGKIFEPRKIVLNQAHTIINFMTSFLLGNVATITGEENTVNEFMKVIRKAKYDRLNYKILDKVLKFGEIYEYVYLDNNVIKSKLIDVEDGTPIYNENNKLIGFIESYVFDGIEYYIVYDENTVSKYNNVGGEIKLVSRNINLSGLPIIYHTDNDYNDIEGSSELNRWINLIDGMEDLLSKAVDGYYHHITGIPVITGQQLKDSLPTDIIGAGLQLDDGATFEFKSNLFDSNAFKTLYETLINSLYEVASIPSITMGRTDISNVSTESIKILYSLAIMKSEKNAQFMKDGMEQRFEKIRDLLALKGLVFKDEQFDSLDISFQYALPTSNSEIIKDLKELRQINGISIETLLEKNPYVSDVNVEKSRLLGEGSNIEFNDNKKEEQTV